MLKNLILYRIGPEWPASADQLAEALALEPFVPCEPTQQKSVGWVPPRAEHGALVEAVGNHWIAKLCIETKSVPGDAVKKLADSQAIAIERTTGRKPGKREMRDLRDEALITLLPHAFPRAKDVIVWIDDVTRILAIDATSQGAADEAITSLVRQAGAGFGIRMLHTRTSPQAAMTVWLTGDDGSSWSYYAFNVGRECELKGSGDEPAVVKFGRHPLQTNEVRQHITEGKLPTKLALDWLGRVGFTLTHPLQLRKIAFQEGVFESERSKDDDSFDADVALTTGELALLIADLIAALGGEVEVAP